MDTAKTTVSLRLSLDSDLYESLVAEARSRQRDLDSIVEDAVALWAESKRMSVHSQLEKMNYHSEILESLIEAFTAPILERHGAERSF